MGFEVVVRLAILPNIRPPRAQVLPPEDNPEQGMVFIKGGNPTSIGASLNWSISWTKKMPHEEEKRVYTKERVYQIQDDKGTINKATFVDIERLSKVRMSATDGPFRYLYEDPPQRANVEILETDILRESSK